VVFSFGLKDEAIAFEISFGCMALLRSNFHALKLVLVIMELKLRSKLIDIISKMIKEIGVYILTILN
jgi:hypothetical protein